MRITIVQGPFLPVPPLLGGAVEKVWYALGKEFSKHGHDVTHISRKFNGLSNKDTSNGVRYLRVKSFNATSSLYINILLDFIYSIRVYRNLPEADILVSNSFSLPVLIRNKKYGQLYVHVARRPKRQFFLYKHAKRIQTVSEAVKQDILSQEPGLRDKLKVINYPVDIKLDDSNFEELLKSKKNNILYVGRIHPEKGIDILIKAFNTSATDLKGWDLDIVGPWGVEQGGGGIKYYDYLNKLSVSSINKIKFIGPVHNHVMLDEYYKNASIFVYPSIAETGESFGLAPLEAMSFGCVPVVSKLDCFREFVEENVNGCIFDHRSANPVALLSDVLLKLVTNQEDLMQKSRNAFIKSKMFSTDRIASTYLDDFTNVIR